LISCEDEKENVYLSMTMVIRWCSARYGVHRVWPGRLSNSK